MSAETEAKIQAMATLASPADEKTLWPQYQSHRVVGAAKIVAVYQDSLLVDNGEPLPVLVPVAHAMFARHTPVAGDYYVVYGNGYVSTCPGEIFEENHTLVVDQPLAAADPATAQKV